MKTNILFNSMLIVIITAMSVFANSPQKGKEIDHAIKTVIEHQLFTKGLIKENKISVEVNNNVVVLTGNVATIEAKKEIEEIAKNVAVNYQIDNKLRLQETNLSDQKIAEAVTKKIQNYIFYTVFDWVTVEVKDGIVTLRGWSQYPWGIKYFAQRAAKVMGVKEVKNEIQLARGSDELRYRAAQVTYNDPLFEYYAYEQNPPVHIIVDGSSVILEGIVTSELEKKTAFSQVFFLSGAPNVINNLIVAKSVS